LDYLSASAPSRLLKLPTSIEKIGYRAKVIIISMLVNLRPADGINSKTETK
jgi:hypothetical protein